MFRRWFQRKSKGAAAPAPQSTPISAAAPVEPPREPEAPQARAAADAAPAYSTPTETAAPGAPVARADAAPPSEPAYTLPASPTATERQRMVEEAAYFLSLERAPGEADPARDWAEAEALVAKRLG